MDEVGKLVRGSPDPIFIDQELKKSPKKQLFVIPTAKTKTSIAETELMSKSLRNHEADLFLKSTSKSIMSPQASFMQQNVRSPQTFKSNDKVQSQHHGLQNQKSFNLPQAHSV
jgi:hypothetical protein